MKTPPPASLESEQAVRDLYDHYWDTEANAFLMKGVVHPILAAATFITGARHDFEGDAEQMIGDHLEDDGRLLLSFEHAKIFDPFVMAGVVQREKALRPIMANAMIGAKGEAYNWHLLIAKFLKHAAAKPAFRLKDDEIESLNPNPDREEFERLVSLAGDLLVAISIENINKGRHVALFPRGQRRDKYDDEPIVAKNLRKGIGRVACGVDEPERLLIVPGAVDYSRGLLRPSTIFGEPIPVPPNATPELVMAGVAPRMQRNREMAAELSAA